MSDKHQELVGFIWSVADLLRGDYKRSEYAKVVLPFTVLRRLDCVLAPTKQKVLDHAELLKGKVANVEPILKDTAGQSFYNTSKLDFPGLLDDPDTLARNLRFYISKFSPGAAEVLEKFRFDDQITRLDDAKLLYMVTGKFAEVDLHPDTVDNHQMGYVFEDLIRKFSEISNETAGEHFTPREVVRLMVNLLLVPDDADLTVPGVVRTVFDPACGTGGMLTETEEHIRRYNKHADVKVYGQELNPESYAICRSDMMLKGQDPENIKLGNSFSNDHHHARRGAHGFDYMLANPPFGVEWKKVQGFVDHERDSEGWRGRFGAGTPRINDGSLLFLQHMISKMKPADQGGSRIAIVFNGSPLFTGAAGSGESEIRRWILEQDWLEAIVALPDQLFYNTGISTYFWILSNRKAPALKDKVILLDGRDYWKKMRKSLGDKRKFIDEGDTIGGAQIAELTEIYRDAVAIAADEDHPHHVKVKIFPRHTFGYQRITVERPLRQRFEMTEDILTAIAEAKQIVKYAHRETLLAALKPLVGTRVKCKSEFSARLFDAFVEGGVRPPANVEKAIWNAVSLSDPKGELQTDRKNNSLPDPDLRDNENVPLTSMHTTDAQLRAEIGDYLQREVLPHAPDAWVDHIKTKVGFEIPFTRHFYVYTPPRPLEEIDAELKDLEVQVQHLLGEVTR